MNDPFPLAPKDAPIPVTARRPMPSVPAQAESGGTPQAMQPQVIYINVATPVSAPPPAPPAGPVVLPPAVENHYTTHHHTYRTTRVQGNSALGIASLALGIVACVVCWVPLAGLAAVPIGAIGVVLGAVGFIVSVLFRRSSAGLPLAGIFVCLLAATISIASTRTLPYWKHQVERAFPSLTRRDTPPAHAGRAPVVNDTVPSGVNVSVPPALPGPAALSDAPRPAVVKPTLPATPTKVDPLVSAAVARLASAERACDDRTRLTTEYQDAVKAANAARAKVAGLRATMPGSMELKDASRAMIDADNAVTDVLERAKATDDEVRTARAGLVGARSGGQSSKF